MDAGRRAGGVRRLVKPDRRRLGGPVRGARRRVSSRSVKWQRYYGPVLVDTNVILESCRIGSRCALTRSYLVETVEDCVTERQTRFQRRRLELAQRLGAGGAVLRVRPADPPGGLHDQRDREPEQHGAPGGAHPRALPQRPRGDEVDLLGAARRGSKMACAAVLLAPSASGARDPLRRPVRVGAIVTGRRDFHRLPTDAWATHGPAPVDSPWKSLRAPARRRISAGAKKLGAASAHRAATLTKYGRSDWVWPRSPKHGISGTPMADDTDRLRVDGSTNGTCKAVIRAHWITRPRISTRCLWRKSPTIIRAHTYKWANSRFRFGRNLSVGEL